MAINILEEDRHKRKFLNFILNSIEKIDNPKILEFGVSDDAMSTGFLLDLCKKNKGSLISVDLNDYEKKFISENWKFIHSRDDNFLLIDKNLTVPLDVIYLDTIHKANHVKKIIYHYYSKLKVGGIFFIDDTSWIPYTKKQDKNNFFYEINNQETFIELLEIYNNNTKKFDIEFSFVGTGIAKITKLNDNELAKPTKILSRRISVINFLRKIYLLTIKKFVNK
mgnify:CR=1 FL=1